MFHIGKLKRDYMEGLIRISDDENLKGTIHSIKEDLLNEGFDKEDIEKLLILKVTEYLALVE